MQARYSRAFVIAVLSAVCAAFSGCGRSDPSVAVTGVIRAPLDAANKIVIEHEDIPGVMPGMTMAFAVAKPATAAALHVGDRVHFQLHRGGSSWTVSDFTVFGRDDAAGAVAPHAPAPARARLHEGDIVPDFSLMTESNQPFTTADFRGRATVVTFIFTRCPVPEFCPAMAARFGQLQKQILADPQLAASARLLSITLDPEFDRPSVLQAYGAAVGARPEIWQFATGSKEEVSALTRSFAVYVERNGVTLDHTLCTALIDGDGRVREIWRGNGWRNEEIVATIRASVAH